MAPIGLHDIMQCYVLDSDKSILRGRCIRVWSILISILKIPAATLGFLFDYILYLFFSCFLPYLYLIQFWISDHRQRLGMNDESFLAILQTSLTVYDIHSIAVWHTHNSFPIYFLESFIF